MWTIRPADRVRAVTAVVAGVTHSIYVAVRKIKNKYCLSEMCEIQRGMTNTTSMELRKNRESGKPHVIYREDVAT